MAFTKITSTNIAEGTVAGYAEFANIANSLAPKITSIAITSNTYSVLDDTAVNVGGGFIVVTGTEFQSGATVLIDTTPATAVSYINNTTLRVQEPAKTAASYNLYVVNPDGGTGIKVAGLTYSTNPNWVTTSPLANVTSNTVFSGNVSATGATSYANTTILPTGFNLLANGYYYGNISVGAATTYSFDIRATDAELQDSDKTFSLTAIPGSIMPTSIEYLLIAGGGAGGGSGSGGTVDGAGGGAGGWLQGTITGSGLSYTITIGAGGASGSQRGNNSTLANSSITRLTYGGGMGGGAGSSLPYSYNGQDGGSGGGAGIHSGSATRGSSIQTSNNGGTGYGFAGGTNQTASPYTAGGGGGAGAEGISGTSGGAGGAGRQWLDGNYYAGGGGTGYNSYGAVNAPGGTGGGGNGGTSAGSTNTGGGGGGRMFAGGSGVCILRYPDSFALATSTTGSPTITTSGGYRYYKFTDSGTITF